MRTTAVVWVRGTTAHLTQSHAQARPPANKPLIVRRVEGGLFTLGDRYAFCGGCAGDLLVDYTALRILERSQRAIAEKEGTMTNPG